MKFTLSDHIPYPLDEVYAVQRDHLASLAEYLPNIESIVVRDRKVEGSVTRLVNVWTASATDIPTAARSFIKPEMLKWTDYATWYDDRKSCDWRLELGFLPEAIEAHGTNRFTTDGSGTTSTISGEIIIHGSRIPGVPRLLAGSLSDAVEKFVVKLIEPNLRKTNEGVRRYLEARHRG